MPISSRHPIRDLTAVGLDADSSKSFQISLESGARGAAAISNQVSRAQPDLPMADERYLEILFVTDPAKDMDTIEQNNDRLLDGSGKWLQMDTNYNEWENPHKSRVLWISGDPGKGKTMLAISMIKRLMEKMGSNTNSSNTLLAYFFCDNKDSRRSSTISVLRSLIYQILVQRPDLTSHFKAVYEREEEQFFTSPNAVQTLWYVLQSLISRSNLQNVYFIIDALDELDLQSIKDLLMLLGPVLGSEAENADHKLRWNLDRYCQVKWLVTSRNIDFISHSMAKQLNISLEVNAGHVRDAVWKFIDRAVEELQKLKGYGSSLTKYVRDTLREKSEGTFLYVSVACRELSQPEIRLLTTKSVLATMPRGLTPLYQRIMDQVTANADRDLVEHAKAILRAMVLAVRPLTVQEIAIAADLPAEYHDDIDILREYIGLCGSFVTRQQDTVYFVHLSVKTYLCSVDQVFHLPVSEYHAQLTRLFLAHICVSKDDSKEEGKEIILLEYPCSSWMHHAQSSESSINWEQNLSLELFSNTSRSRQQWLNIYWPLNNPEWEKQPARFSPLHLAAYSGIHGLVMAVLSRRDPVDEADSFGHTALIWAAKGGYNDIVKLLLEHGANLETKTQNGLTALVFAIINGHQKVVHELIKQGAKVSTTDKLGWTPLHHAATHGHTKILGDILEAGAEVNIKDIAQQSALQRAAFCCDLKSIQILVDWKADVSVTDKDKCTLLHRSCGDGELDLVTFWIKHFVDIEATDNQSWTSLMHAAWNGHPAVAAFLIQNGAKLESKAMDGSTALHLATWNGHAHVTKVLLEGKSNPNSEDDMHETPLQQAAWRGHIGVCRVLLKSGADPNTRSDSGVTPLHQAASNGHDAVVRLLFEWAAEPNAIDSLNITPAARAEESGHLALAELLRSFETMDENEEYETVQHPGEFQVVDQAVSKLLDVPSESCMGQSQGAGFSKYTKIIAFVNGETTYYFMKSSEKEEVISTEFLALRAMYEVVPSICPYVLGHGKLTSSNEYFMLMEYVDMTYRPNGALTGSGLTLAQKLAKLHSTPAPIPIGYHQPMFGFPVWTYTGPVFQNNGYYASWSKFFTQNRLMATMKLIDDAHGTDQELKEGVEDMIRFVVPRLLGNGHLGGLRGITPVLVHGGLWAGNRLRGTSAAWSGWEEVVVDPSCAYAHSEYELSIMRMFGGFSAGFFNEYHRLVPKTEPKHEYEDRVKLYQLYHYLNHYLVYRGGYKDDSMDIINALRAKYIELDKEDP